MLVKVIRESAAAGYVGLSAHTLRWHRKRGTGPAYYRLGEHSIGYAFEDLDDWLALRWINPEPEIAEKANDASLAELMRLAPLAGMRDGCWD